MNEKDDIHTYRLTYLFTLVDLLILFIQTKPGTNEGLKVLIFFKELEVITN